MRKKAKPTFRLHRRDSIGAADAEGDEHYLRTCFVDTGDINVLRDRGRAHTARARLPGVSRNELESTMDTTDERLMREAINWSKDCQPVKKSIPKVGAVVAVNDVAIAQGRRGTGRPWSRVRPVFARFRKIPARS
jgi:hypothetical protein